MPYLKKANKKLEMYDKENSIKRVKEYNFEFIKDFEKTTSKVGIRIGTSDYDVFKQIFLQDEYLPIVELFKSKNFNPIVIIDLGANVGYTTLYLKKFYPHAKYYAVEPYKPNFIMVSKNLESQGVALMNKAIWRVNGQVDLNCDFRDGKEWSMAVSHEQSSKSKNSIIIDAITFHEYVSNYDIKSIDFLKMDIEGAEESVLFSDGFLKCIDKVKCIAVEIHDEVCSRQRICDLFSSHGFTWFNSGELVVAHKFD